MTGWLAGRKWMAAVWGLSVIRSVPAQHCLRPQMPTLLRDYAGAVDEMAENRLRLLQARDGRFYPISAAIDDIVTGEQTQAIRSVTGAVKIMLLAIAVLLGIASLFLIGNTIRLSIYARRREVEVMQLVGATNWFIRWPFVIEGIVVGMVGSAIAVGIMVVAKAIIVDPLSDDLTLIDNFDTIAFGPLIASLVIGAMVLSALGSGVTLRRFLRI